LTIDVTLQEFYDHTGVEIHMYATELNTYKSMDFSYKTHPDWRVCDACYASCSIPILFSPIITETDCFVDGCFLSNYPIGHFREQFNSEIMSDSLNMDEIFGINIVEQNESFVHINTNIIVTIEHFLFCIFYKIIEYLASFQPKIAIPYEIKIVKSISILKFSYNSIFHSNYRENIIECGRQSFRENVLKWWGGAATDSPTTTPTTVDCHTE
jgi:predicted acylesterase/phospholipase RssA